MPPSVLVLAASIFGAGFPVVAKKVKWVKVPAKTFFICKHFGTGVLVATAFVHVRSRDLEREQNERLTSWNSCFRSPLGI